MDAEDQTRQLLRAYGERSTPSAAGRERAWTAIAAAAAVAPSSAAATPPGTVALKVALGVGAVLIVGAASWAWMRASDHPRPPTSRAAEASSTVPPVGVAAGEEVSATPEAGRALVGPTTEVASVTAGLARSEVSRALPAAVPARVDRTAAETAVEPVPPTAPVAATAADAIGSPGTLAEELALMDQARAALARNDVPATLLALDQHAARFPAGTLARERDVVRVTALCAAGRDDEAVAVAAAAGPRPAIVRALSRCERP